MFTTFLPFAHKHTQTHTHTQTNTHTHTYIYIGIGSKVADCICLMSLDKLEAIPVDTHVWQIAKNYMPQLEDKKSLTDKLYIEIGDYYRELYGNIYIYTSKYSRRGWE